MSRARDIARLPKHGARIIPLLVTEAYERESLGWPLSVSLHPEQFGAVGDGISNDTPAFAACVARLVALFNGGTIRCTGRYRIATSLTLPNGVRLEGVGACHGDIYPSSDGNRGSTLIVDGSATILCRNGSGARNLMIARTGLTYGITSAQVTASFVGTGFTLATNTGDHLFQNLFILGFEFGIKSQDTTTVGSAAQNNRVRIDNVSSDCLTDFWLHNSYDVSYITRCQIWPRVTVGSAAEANNAHLKRAGVGTRLSGVNDWTKISDTFTFGKAKGAQVTDSRSVTFMGVSHDHPPGSADGSYGYYFDGTCAEIRVIGGQAAGKQYAAWVSSTYNQAVGGPNRLAALFDNFNAWEYFSDGIVNDRGDILVTAGGLRKTGGSSGNGVRTTATSGVTTLNGVDFRGNAIAINNFSSSTVLRHRNCTFGLTNPILIQNAYQATIAAAASIVPNGDDFVFTVTGTTGIASIGSPQRYVGDRLLSLTFQDGLTVFASGNIATLTGSDMSFRPGGSALFLASATGWLMISATGVNGIRMRPVVAEVPAVNGEMTITRASNTSLVFSLKGTDGVVRSASLALT